MSDDTSELVVVPFNMLSAEKEPNPDPSSIEEQNDFIRKIIINKAKAELVGDEEAMKLVAQLGSDLMITHSLTILGSRASSTRTCHKSCISEQRLALVSLNDQVP